MSATVIKILTYYLIQSYLLKKSIYCTSATDVFQGSLCIFQKQPLECFLKNCVFKNFAILTGKLQACNFIENRLFNANIYEPFKDLLDSPKKTASQLLQSIL